MQPPWAWPTTYYNGATSCHSFISITAPIQPLVHSVVDADEFLQVVEGQNLRPTFRVNSDEL